MFRNGLLEMIPHSAIQVVPRMLLPQWGPIGTGAAFLALLTVVRLVITGIPLVACLVLSVLAALGVCEILRRVVLRGLLQFIRRQTDMYSIPQTYQTEEAGAARCAGFWVAEDSDGRLVGMVALREAEEQFQEKKKEKNREKGSTGELLRMSVHRDFRRRGVARLLVEHLEQQARQMGYTRIVLGTSSLQIEAIAMYKRLGYRVIRVDHHIPLVPVCFPTFAKDL